MKPIPALICAFLVSNLTAFGQPSAKTVQVSTVEELFSSLGSNTTILLAPGDYHLETIDSQMVNPVCTWATVLFDEIYDEAGGDDSTLLIRGVANLTLRANEVGSSVRILTNRRSASVLAFQNCKALTLEGITLGHNLDYKHPEQWNSYCSGEVLEFFDSENVNISSCVLFGCGTRGFLAHRCRDFLVTGSEIKECSYGAFGVFDSENVSVTKTIIRDNIYDVLFEIQNCYNVQLFEADLLNNTRGQYSGGPVNVSGSEGVQFISLDLEGNDFEDPDIHNFSGGFEGE